MTPFNMLLVFGVVVAISTGQILFRKTGLEIEANGLWHLRPLAFGFVALVIYGIATLAWIYVLRKVPLSIGYPFIAFSFIIVPTLGRYFFNEAISLTYYAGAALIVAGVAVIAWSTGQGGN